MENLEKRISKGDFPDFLPGELKLSTAFGVSRSSVRSALQLLNKQGIVEPIKGKGWRVLKAPSLQTNSLEKHVVTVVPRKGVELGSVAVQIVYKMEHMLEKTATFEVVVTKSAKMQRPGQRLQKLVDSYRCDCWILVQSSTATQRWFAKHNLPCVILGSCAEGVEFPNVDVDWEATGRHLISTLYQYGHREVFVVERHLYAKGSKKLKNSYLETARAMGVSVSFVDSNIDTVEQIKRCVAAANPATAIVFYEFEDLLAGVTWLAKHGVNIPRDISVVCLHDDILIGRMYPKMTYYKRVPDAYSIALAKLVSGVLEGRSKNQEILHLQSFVEGESLRDINVRG